MPNDTIRKVVVAGCVGAAVGVGCTLLWRSLREGDYEGEGAVCSSCSAGETHTHTHTHHQAAARHSLVRNPTCSLPTPTECPADGACLVAAASDSDRVWLCVPACACVCVRACIPNRVCTWHASGSWDRGKHSMLHNTTHSRTQLWCACTALTRLAWALVDWLAARHTGVIFKGKLPADQRPTTWLFLWVVLCASAMLSSLVYRTACGTCGSTRRERERGGGGAAAR